MIVPRREIIALAAVAIFTAALVVSSCTTGVEPSPQPGIVRITLQSDPADTLVVILNQTIKVSARDYFGVTIFQGKVFAGDKFAFLFNDLTSYTQEDRTYNLLEKEGDQYRRFTIYESFVPPENLTRIQFGVVATQVRLGYFEIPATLPDGAPRLQDLQMDFEVFEHRVTEINVQISPFKSVTRYRDTYQFKPAMKILGVVYH